MGWTIIGRSLGQPTDHLKMWYFQFPVGEDEDEFEDEDANDSDNNIN